MPDALKNFSFTLQPVFPGYTSLPEDPDKKVDTNLWPVGVRDGEDKIPADHVRVSPPMKRAVKTKRF